jgi:hypothetical protein
MGTAAEGEALLQEAGLSQHAYFLARDLSFLRDQEPVLQAELGGS